MWKIQHFYFFYLEQMNVYLYMKKINVDEICLN